jgi:hypothetical protein
METAVRIADCGSRTADRLTIADRPIENNPALTNLQSIRNPQSEI